MLASHWNIIGVDLARAPRDVLAATRHAALHLVHQANQQAGLALAAVA
jgi:hypothetical protein